MNTSIKYQHTKVLSRKNNESLDERIKMCMKIILEDEESCFYIDKINLLLIKKNNNSISKQEEQELSFYQLKYHIRKGTFLHDFELNIELFGAEEMYEKGKVGE